MDFNQAEFCNQEIENRPHLCSRMLNKMCLLLCCLDAFLYKFSL